MKYTYEISEGKGGKVIKRTSEDGEVTWIPFAEGNSDYQAYLRWLENPDAQ
jgi:hypothetical protein